MLTAPSPRESEAHVASKTQASVASPWGCFGVLLAGGTLLGRCWLATLSAQERSTGMLHESPLGGNV